MLQIDRVWEHLQFDHASEHIHKGTATSDINSTVPYSKVILLEEISYWNRTRSTLA